MELASHKKQVRTCFICWTPLILGAETMHHEDCGLLISLSQSVRATWGHFAKPSPLYNPSFRSYWGTESSHSLTWIHPCQVPIRNFPLLLSLLLCKWIPFFSSVLGNLNYWWLVACYYPDLERLHGLSNQENKIKNSAANTLTMWQSRGQNSIWETSNPLSVVAKGESFLTRDGNQFLSMEKKQRKSRACCRTEFIYAVLNDNILLFKTGWSVMWPEHRMSTCQQPCRSQPHVDILPHYYKDLWLTLSCMKAWELLIYYSKGTCASIQLSGNHPVKEQTKYQAK